MAKLNAAQKRWVAKVNAALAECPTPGEIGFYTIGDNDVILYDCRRTDEIFRALEDRLHHATDFGPAVNAVGAGYDEVITFPQPVESTAG